MAAELTIEPATAEHAHLLAPQMREEDVREVLAAGSKGSLHALLESLAISRVAFTARINGQVAAIFGTCVPARAEVGVAWLLTGNLVSRHRKVFLQGSREMLALLLEDCPVLCNFVDARYAGALRWAKWLGFTLEKPVPYGPEGLPFHPIVIRRQNV